MALSDKAKRRTAAASLAVAIAIPAEGFAAVGLSRPAGHPDGLLRIDNQRKGREIQPGRMQGPAGR